MPQYYRINPNPVIILSESFEYIENWSGTIPDSLYYKTYTFTATNTLSESFETSEGW
jgi:hypothetical protein